MQSNDPSPTQERGRAIAADHWTRREMRGIPASLGALWTHRDADGGWRYAVQLDQSHANAQGLVHGGVIVTFMDHALSLLAWEASGRALCSTIQLDTHFLSGVRPPAFLELDARILQQGKSKIFMQGSLRQDERVVAQATGVWNVAKNAGTN